MELTGEVAAADALCPTCGLEIGGYTVGRTKDGRTTWDRPMKVAAGPSGTQFMTGGLTHIEGGERCRP